MSAWLAAAYAALALGLGWTLASSGAWRRRVPYIVLAPTVAVALWLFRPDPAGWPTSERVPPHAVLQWALVREPDPAASDPGGIYLWLDVGSAAPRAYSLPYSRALHEQVQRALHAVSRGEPIGVSIVSRGTRQSGGRTRAVGRRGVIRFYARPPVVLPPKTR